MKISIPAHFNASRLLPMVVDLGRVPDNIPLELDFSALRRITPAGLALLASTIIRWRREQRPLTLTGLSACAITGYLQRMDFFKTCGIEMPENFRRHNASGRFMPLRLVEYPTETLGREMAACVAPGGDDYEHPLSWLYDMVFYVLTETANNVDSTATDWDSRVPRSTARRALSAWPLQTMEKVFAGVLSTRDWPGLNPWMMLPVLPKP